MNVYIITYDLIKEGQNYETKNKKIRQLINKYAWARLSESCYAVESNEKSEIIFKKFNVFLDDNDKFFILKLQGEYYGKGTDNIHDWLFKRLKF